MQPGFADGEGAEVYVALGSNLGSREAILVAALEVIRADAETSVFGLSPVFETEPVGPGEQGCYLNAVAGLHTTHDPIELLDLLQSIEIAAGRDRSSDVPRWSARTLDLDLLFYDSRCIALPRLTIPHPRAHERDFVLAPMAALAPDFVHPVSGKTIAELASARSASSAVRQVPSPPGWSVD